MKTVKVIYTLEYIVASVKTQALFLKDLSGDGILFDDAIRILSEKVDHHLEIYKSDKDALNSMILKINENDELKKLAKSVLNHPMDMLIKDNNLIKDVEKYFTKGVITFEIAELSSIRLGDYFLLPNLKWVFALLLTNLEKINLSVSNEVKSKLKDLSHNKSSDDTLEVFSFYIDNHDKFIEDINNTFPTKSDKDLLHELSMLFFQHEINEKNSTRNILNGLINNIYVINKST
jgi:hypothetical protein